MTTRWARLAVCAAVVASAAACSMSERSHTVDGTAVTPNPAPDNGIDPCDLPAQLLNELGVRQMPLSRAAGAGPTCTWELGPYHDPSMYYWISGPTAADNLNEATTIAGVRAEVFYESEGLSRYIVRLDNHTIDAAYSAGTSADTPSGPDGARLLISGLLTKYGYN